MGLRSSTTFPGPAPETSQPESGAVSRGDLAIFAILFDALLAVATAVAALRLVLHVPIASLRYDTQLGALDLSAGDAGRCLAWFLFAVFLVAWHYGLYSRCQPRNAWNDQRLSLQACLGAGLLLCGGLYLSAGAKARPEAIAWMVASTSVLFGLRRAVTRYRIHRQYKHGLGRRRLLIAGENRISEALRSQVENDPGLGREFRGFLRVPGGTADRCCPRKDVAGSIYEIASIAQRGFIDEVVITEYGEYEQVNRAIETARKFDLDLRILPGIHEPLTLHGPLTYLGHVPLIYLHRRRPVKLSLRAKRVIDVIGSAVGLLVLSPVMLAIASALAIEGGEPIVATESLGRRSSTLHCYKFRSAGPRVRAGYRASRQWEDSGRAGDSFSAEQESDSRIGRFVSRYGLEGLPQLFNVFVGEMSLVGPRALSKSDPKSHRAEHLQCLRVAPGITGAWLLTGRAFISAEASMAADTRYVQDWSLWLDITIMARTLRKICGEAWLASRGAYSGGRNRAGGLSYSGTPSGRKR